MLALLGGGCPEGVGGVGGDPVEPEGIRFSTATGDFTRTAFVLGEEFDLPVAITPIPGETPGTTVDVSAIHRLQENGFENVGNSIQTMTLPQQGSWAYTTFRLRAIRERPIAVLLVAHRTAAGEGRDPRTSRAAKFVPGVVKVTLTPSSAQIVRNTDQTFTLSILPVGSTSGPQTLRLLADTPRLTVTPNTLTVDLVQGSVTPIERTVVVRPAADTTLGDHNLFVEQTYPEDDPVLVAFAPIEVILGSNPPDYTVTVTPSAVTAPNSILSPPVTFTLRSLNNFDGVVTLTHSSESEYEVVPNPTLHRVTVRPGAPVTFTRQFYRFFHTTPVLIKFRATTPSIPEAKEVTVTVNHGAGSPSFTFAADPQTISGQDYVLTEQAITFTLTPVNGFSGPVVVSYSSDALGTDPSANNRTITLLPAEPQTFTQRFERSAVPGPQTMTWTATHSASGTTRTLTITVNPL